MSSVRRTQRLDRLRVGVFLAVSSVATAYLVAVTSDYRAGDTVTYAAEFRNVSGLQEGDPVRIGGVDQGRVTGLSVAEDSVVTVHFDVDSEVELNSSSTATVHYANLVGDRYLELARPTAEGAVLEPGSVLDLDHTFSALDLDSLLNGFKPLFVGLAPQHINALSRDLVAVLDGQASAISSLLTTLGEVTGSLGDRQGLISAVVGNLSTVLGTVDERSGTLADLIDQLSLLTQGLQKSDRQIVADVAAVTDMAGSVASVVSEVRGDLPPILEGLEATAAGLNSNARVLQAVLDRLPKHYDEVLQTASYGNFFNFFLCGVRLQLGATPESASLTPWIRSDQARCKR